jgi:hypothetical protein
MKMEALVVGTEGFVSLCVEVAKFNCNLVAASNLSCCGIDAMHGQVVGVLHGEVLTPNGGDDRG